MAAKDVKLDVNSSQLEEAVSSAITDSIKEFRTSLRNKVYCSVRDLLDELFMDEQTIKQRMKYGRPVSKDAGYVSREISSAIDDLVLNSDMKELVRKHAEVIYERYVQEAIEAALRHKAKREAFLYLKQKDQNS